MNSKLKFRYHNTDLNTDEAAALLSIVDGGENTVIDLSKVIKINARNATEMFSLAVKHKNPALANLAARLAITNNGDDRSFLKPTKNVSGPNALKTALEKPIEGDVENIIESLIRRDARWAAGVASILMFAPEGPDEDNMLTLKEISVEQNKFLKIKRLNYKCLAFKGFANGIEPMDKPKIPRAQSFFTSPTYNALREGLIFCKANQLVNLRQGVSVGGSGNPQTQNYPPTDHLQRNYWKIQLSERGMELAEKWGDISDFLVNFWGNRMV